MGQARKSGKPKGNRKNVVKKLKVIKRNREIIRKIELATS